MKVFVRARSILCVPAIGAGCGGLRASEDASDVFLITIDTLSRRSRHCYGYYRGPDPAWTLGPRRIRFAQAFTRVYHQYFSRQHSHRTVARLTRCHRFAVPLNPSHPTVAELVKKQNYHMAAFIGAVISTARRWLRDSTAV